MDLERDGWCVKALRYQLTQTRDEQEKTRRANLSIQQIHPDRELNGRRPDVVDKGHGNGDILNINAHECHGRRVLDDRSIEAERLLEDEGNEATAEERHKLERHMLVPAS